MAVHQQYKTATGQIHSPLGKSLGVLLEELYMVQLIRP